MKITRRQLRKLISESADDQQDYTQKLMSMIESGGLAQAEQLASALEIDLFDKISNSYKVINTIMKDIIKPDDIRALLDRVMDNSYYEDGYFNVLLDQLPLFPQLSFGMSKSEIIDLINNAEESEVYLDADMEMGMRYTTLYEGGGMVDVTINWLNALLFLKLAKIREETLAAGSEFSISDTLQSMSIPAG